jgi:hypothetical protein
MHFMMITLKLLLAVTTLAVCIYGVKVFGFSIWPLGFSILSGLLLFSIYYPKINQAAVTIAKIMGLLSLLALALLLLAATIGGSFYLSPSNQIIAIGLALMAVFGCGIFLIKHE